MFTEAMTLTHQIREWPERFGWYVAWHPERPEAFIRMKDADSLAEWRSREWRDFPSAPEIVDVTRAVHDVLLPEWMAPDPDASDARTLRFKYRNPELVDVRLTEGRGLELREEPDPRRVRIPHLLSPRGLPRAVRGGMHEFLENFSQTIGLLRPYRARGDRVVRAVAGTAFDAGTLLYGHLRYRRRGLLPIEGTALPANVRAITPSTGAGDVILVIGATWQDHWMELMEGR